MKNMKEFISIARSSKLSTFCNDRYVIVNKVTNKIIDDANGYGYKSYETAKAAVNYKYKNFINL